MNVHDLIQLVPLLAASSSSESSGGAFGLIFLLSGFGFYAYVYFRYRNVSQRHHYETETEATKLNVQTVDEKVRTLTGLSNSSMQGANNTAVQGAGGLPLSMNQLKGLTGQLGSMMGQIQSKTATPGTTAPPPSGASPTPPPPPSAPPGPPPQGPGQAF